MAEEGITPYRPRRGIPVDFDDDDFDDDLEDEPGAHAGPQPGRRGSAAPNDAPFHPRHGSPAGPASPPASTWAAVPPATPAPAEPQSAPTPVRSAPDGLGTPAPDRPGFAAPAVSASAPPPAPASSPAPAPAPTVPAPVPAPTAPVGGARRRPTLPGRGYQPRHSAASTASAPARSARSAPGVPARSAASAPARARVDPIPTPAPAEPPGPAGPSGPRRILQRLGRRGLLIAGVAAALVVVLAVVYSVWSLGAVRVTEGVPSTNPTSSGGSASPATDDGPITTRMMTSPQQAAGLLAKSSWSVVTDTKGITEDSVTATCLGKPGTNEPAAQSTRIRTLAADGDNAPAVFHQADLYATPADAIQAMSVRSQALGQCSTPYALLLDGLVGTDLGNSAIGVTVLIQDSPSAYHTVLMNRTGRMVNVVDVASQDAATFRAMTAAKVGTLLAKTTGLQCTYAIGLCATNAQVRTTVPPIGDTAGLLSVADVPRVGTSTGAWTPGDPTRKPSVAGSNCEATDFGAVKGSTATLARTYILADDPGFFGFDTVLLTMPTPAAASALAASISDKISTCQTRLLTATVSGKTAFTGTGLGNAAVSGTTYVVTQKIDGGKTSLRYRVGIGSVGNKVVYSFANPKGQTDFTDAQWTALNVRMGQRATQVT